MILPVRPHFIFDMLREKEPNPKPFILPVPIRSSGSPTLLEQCLLIATGRVVEAKAIFEIGTFKGATTSVFDQNFPDADIATIDLNPAQSDALLSGAEIERLKGHSRSFDFSPWNRKCSLVFIDGGHDYQSVKSDTENALRMIHTNGAAAIVWHDYGKVEYDVTRYLLDELESLAIYRVEETSLAIYFKALP